MIFTTFSENVSQQGTEEEFVKLTEVVLKFELKRTYSLLIIQPSMMAVFFGQTTPFTTNFNLTIV